MKTVTPKVAESDVRTLLSTTQGSAWLVVNAMYRELLVLREVADAAAAIRDDGCLDDSVPFVSKCWDALNEAGR